MSSIENPCSQERALAKGDTGPDQPRRAPDGRDVSAMIMRPLVMMLDERNIPLGPILKDATAAEHQLRSLRGWIDWDSYVHIVQACEEHFSDDDFRKMARDAFELPVLRFFSLVGWVIRSEANVYRWVGRQVFGPGALLLRPIHFEVVRASRDHIVIELTAVLDMPVRRSTLIAVAEGLAVVPSFLGEPEGEVHTTFIDGGARYEIALRHSSFWRRSLRRLGQVAIPWLTARELKSSYDLLLERSTELDLRIEQLHESERARERLRTQLKHAERLEAVGRLAGGVAHDFNNLLTVILMHAEFIGSNPQDAMEDAAIIRDAAARASRITSRLLAFSRQQLMLFETLDVNRLIRGLEPVVRALSGEMVQLQLDLCDEVAAVHTDRGQIEQILVNLIVNARDAMPNGGRLCIETSIEDDEVCIRVEDSGVGMDAQTIAQIFDPFFTTKGPDQGTGLGLATVYGVIEQSNGTIHVESEPGIGSVFTIRLPLRQEPPVNRPLPTSVADVQAQLNLMLVEDEDGVRIATHRILERAGYHVVAAATPAEALELVEERPLVHIVVTDVVMPGMNGVQLATRLREIYPALPILFISGYPKSDGDFPEDNHSSFLQKPFTPDSLLERLRQLAQADAA